MNIFLILGIVILVILLFLVSATVGSLNAEDAKRNSQKTQEEIEEDAQITANITKKVEELIENKYYTEAQTLAIAELRRNPSNHAVRFCLATAFYETRNFSRALDQLLILQKYFPGKLEVLMMSANAYHSIGQDEKALLQYKRVLAVDKGNMEALKNIAQIYYDMGHKNFALRIYQRIIQLVEDPKEIAEYYTIIGTIYADVMEFEDAISQYKTALKYDPDNKEVLTKLKDAYKYYGDPEAAIEYLKRAVEDAPRDKETYFMYEELINLLYKKGDYDEAFNYCQEALQFKDANRGTLQNIIAKIYIRTQKSEDSIMLLQDALVSYPDDIYLRQTLANAYVSQGNYEKAIAVYDDIFNIADRYQFPLLRSNLSSIICQYAIDLFRQKKYTEAYDKFLLALKYDDQNAEVYYHLGRTAYFNRNYADAIKQFRRAVDNAPSNIEYYMALANVYEQVENVYEAVRVYKDLVAIDPTNAKAHASLGVIYAKQREISPAVEEFKLALQSDPNDVTAMYNLALAYEILGEIDMAIGMYRRVLDLSPDHKEARNNLNILTGENRAKLQI